MDPRRLGPPRRSRRADPDPAHLRGDLPGARRRRWARPRAARRPARGRGAARFTVRPQELDPLDHANNAVYADWLEEAVIAAGDRAATAAIRALVRLEYALPAEADATVDAVVWPDDDGWSYRLLGPDGNDLLRARLERG